MMKITLFPFLADQTIEASVKGDVITINGEAIDFSKLKAGFRLPNKAVSNWFFVESGYVERINGALCFTLRLPVSFGTEEQYKNPPTPIVLEVVSGPVPFPNTAAPEIAPVEMSEEVAQEVSEND